MEHTINSIDDLFPKFQFEEQYENIRIDFDLEIFPHNIHRFRHLVFKNCIFKKLYIHHLTEPHKDIKFINCIFLNDVDISINEIRDFTLVWHLHNNTNDNCNINSIFLGSKFNFSSNRINEYCYINGMNYYQEAFHFMDNIFIKQPREIHVNRKTDYVVCRINNCNINNGSFNNNTFYMPFEFLDNNLSYNSRYTGHTFKNNLFQKANFSKTNFGGLISFHDSKFFSTTLFTDCRNLTDTNLIFSSCEFKGFTLFDRSKLYCLELRHSMFEKKTSFDLLEVNRANFHQTTFLQGAFFDDIKINDVENKKYLKGAESSIRNWRRTLRLIKQELLKAENKIDSNQFRNYELAVHYREIKIFNNFKDVIILWATKWSTNFGNWFWAFWFTIITGLMWYSGLYFIEYHGSYSHEKINDFFVGAFRFFLITDFYSPFEERKYLDNVWSWFPFVIGKIFIAFGIYEMIQAFRKFKA